MDLKKILSLKNAKENSCIDCTYGVIVPNDKGQIDFAKCKSYDSGWYFFNFNLYEKYSRRVQR